jgi:Cu/Ag efflux pump CusA
MAVALTVTPALTLLSLSRAGDRRESPVARELGGAYAGLLSRLLRRPQPIYAAAAAVVLAGVAAAPHLKQSLLPRFKETQVLIRWDSTPGTSLTEMNRITSLASRDLRSLPGVRNVGAHVGRAVTADQVVGVNSGEIWVGIDPKADYDATLASVKRVAAGYPGLSGNVQTYSNERVREVLSGSGGDVGVRIYGESTDVLRQKAAEVREALTGIDGLVRERVALPATEPSLEIKVDLAAAERYGIKPGDVRRAAAALLSGIGVGSLFEEQKVFDVVVWGTPKTRSSLSAIRNLLIDTPAGGHVRLGQVAETRIVPTDAVIHRQAVSRYIDVVADVRGRDRGAVVHDVNNALARIDFPLETHPEVLAANGQPEGRLIAVGVAVAVGILLLLQAAFGSWRLAALCFLTLPLALVGGLVAALADGGTLSFGSYIGLFAVFGLAARSAILLIDRCRHLERREDDGLGFGAELVVRAAKDRVAPILMTAAGTALVLLPLVVAGPIAGLEIVHPMAVVILGGLVTSTLLGLFVLPALYLRLGPSRDREAVSLWKRLQRRAFPRRSGAPQEIPVRSEPSS